MRIKFANQYDIIWCCLEDSVEKNVQSVYHMLHGTASNVVRPGPSVNGNRSK
jgi:hypothetical protein